MDQGGSYETSKTLKVYPILPINKHRLYELLTQFIVDNLA